MSKNAITCCVAVLSVCSCALAELNWVSLSPSPTWTEGDRDGISRFGYCAGYDAATSKTYIYTVGGLGWYDWPVHFERYDIEADMWTDLSPPSYVMGGYACTAFAYDYDSDGSDEIFCIGGYPNWSLLDMWDPETGYWKPLKVGGYSHVYYHGGAILDGYYYVTEGAGNENDRAFQRMNLTETSPGSMSFKWNNGLTRAPQDNWLLSCVAYDGKLYAFGNHGGNFAMVYDPAEQYGGDTDRNGTIDGLDLTAVISAWGLTKDAVGSDEWRNVYQWADLDDNDVIDGLDLTEVIANWGTPENPWTVIGPHGNDGGGIEYARPRAVLYRDKILLIGGYKWQDPLPDNCQTDEIWAFDPTDETYELVGHLPEGRYCHGVVIIGDELYVWGGRNAGGPTVRYATFWKADISDIYGGGGELPEPATTTLLVAAGWMVCRRRR